MCHKHLQALQAAMGWINVQVHIFLREDQPALPPTPTTPVSPVVKFKEENENSAQLEERVKQLEKRLQESEAKAATLQVKFEEKSNKLVQQIQAAQSPRQLPAASSSSSSSRSSSEEDAPPPPPAAASSLRARPSSSSSSSGESSEEPVPGPLSTRIPFVFNLPYLCPSPSA